ncbi:MAG: protein-glutamate O-methyltransferase CheR [Myxococcales bacterium]|nr:protein-glutamate O-methyltransferase CheR [Myxococcales bacterium]MCB9702007.1 protein-glutamate O-methyltransferase CheR [Myxococcales bacterium]
MAISEAEIGALQAIVEGYCGLSHGLDSGYLLERRLGPRVRALGLDSFASYCEYLRRPGDGPQELAEVIEELTTHETYFFREQFQLDAFQSEVLPELARARRHSQRLTIWSAGCSTGEEPYTIAMLLLESGLFRGWSISVIGTDISRKVLSAARFGVYGASSFRTTDPLLRERYFTAQGEGFRIRDEVRGLCSFRQHNLLDPCTVVGAGGADVVFCRNVLMYMGSVARRRIVGCFHDSLSPGGYLLLGHSESLINLATPFELVHLDRDLVYRRAL